MPLYDSIGGGYDRTRQADPRIVEKLIHHLRPRDGGAYVDVGCGTGNYTVALARAGAWHVTGVDVSEVMLAEARAKEAKVDWRMGECAALPLDPAGFDGAIATMLLHHVDELAAAFAGVRRVLKPDARLVLFTATPEQIEGYWLNAYFPELMRRAAEVMPSLGQIVKACGAGGLQLAELDLWDVPQDLTDHVLYAGKHRPDVYLDDAVRAGISAFAQFDDADEIAEGVARLRADIGSGRFEDVRERYANRLGDYCFLVLSAAG